jgi:hypothetical protein
MLALHRRPKIGQIAPPPTTLRYHIDYSWWEKSNRDLRVYLQSHLCTEHQELYARFDELEEIDWIDPRTAEVRKVDGLEHTLHTHCSLQPEYITPNTPLVNAVFRVFLANGNSPMTAEELAGRVGRQPEMITRTLSSGQVYKGIRPIEDEA